MGALSGIRVVDLSRILAAPFATQALADHGADVIKIEPPGGDETRTWGPPFRDGISAYFTGLNRGKRSIAIDLGNPRGQDVLRRLLARADVLVENFKKGTLERWGFGDDTALLERYPRLVHFRMTGFGLDGPLGGLPGYDAVAQAMGGVMAVNGAADGPPVRNGVPVADLAAGMLAVQGIVMALLERERSGRGQTVEVSLLDAAVSLLHPHGANCLMSRQRPRRTGNAHPNIAPYDLFETAAGPIFVAVGNDRQFARLCAELGLPDAADDERFRSNALRLQHQEELRQVLAPRLAQRRASELAERLLAIGVPAGAVLEVDEILAHPQTRHRGMVVEVDGYRGIGVPVKLDRTPGCPGGPPPALGQDAEAILREAGLAETEIAELRAAGIVSDGSG